MQGDFVNESSKKPISAFFSEKRDSNRKRKGKKQEKERKEKKIFKTTCENGKGIV